MDAEQKGTERILKSPNLSSHVNKLFPLNYICFNTKYLH